MNLDEKDEMLQIEFKDHWQSLLDKVMNVLCSIKYREFTDYLSNC